MSTSKTKFEFSAGGVAIEDGKLLMVKVENLEGHHIWTFPKGHLEKDEKSEQAALREVEEETGYQCAIVEPLERAQYWFKRDDTLTKKTVAWYLMKPVKLTGKPDPDEILETNWVTMEEAKTLVRYKSDKKLLAKLEMLVK
jgi:8-oxo-dGTP pyrophosphatase MutT (NUDIX family)